MKLDYDTHSAKLFLADYNPRHRTKKVKHGITREVVQKAVTEYLAAGGTIEKQESHMAEYDGYREDI